jgi:ADP-ribosylglycohydrolase
MLGAIAGDICGSPYEGGSCLPPHLAEKPKYGFQLFAQGSGLTDDTVCTIAIAEALLSDMDFAASLRRWTLRYPGRGYGRMFLTWATSTQGPYQSFSNGGAMRVSPCALLARTLEDAEQLATISAQVTHNHTEGLRGARAIAAAIWLARQGARGSDLRRELQNRFGYDLRAPVAARAQVYKFSTLAEETVPNALVCAIEADSWEQAVTNAVWIGGDSDTVACMAGGIAEAQFGVPLHWATTAIAKLPPDMLEVLRQMYERADVASPWLAREPSGETVPTKSAHEPLMLRRFWEKWQGIRRALGL